jgi:hypothetical protein
MEITNQLLDLEYKNLGKANYIYTILYNAKGRTSLKWDEGLIFSNIKLKNNKEYSVYIMSNSIAFSYEEIGVHIAVDKNMDMMKSTLDEYYINGNEKFLRFNNEAYFRIIENKEGEEVKMVFTDYNDVIEYLRSIESEEK